MIFLYLHSMRTWNAEQTQAKRNGQRDYMGHPDGSVEFMVELGQTLQFLALKEEFRR